VSGDGRPVAGVLSGLAPWETRVFASWLDLVVVGLPALVPLGYALATAEPRGPGSDASDLTPAGIVAAWVAILLYLVIWSWNRYVRTARTGQSLGKRRRGITVRTVTGEVPGTGRLVARDLAHVLDVLPLFVGLLWPAWDRRRQTFADKIAGTVVTVA
jgi:uncharacterized RDD family membrane protein YckC